MPDTETLSTDLFVDCLAGRLKGAEVGKLEGLKALPDDVPTGVLVPFAVTVGVILGRFGPRVVVGNRAVNAAPDRAQ